MEQMLNQIIPILITAVVGALAVIIKSIGDAVVSFIEVKKEAVVLQMGIDGYNQQLKFAKSIWGIVDENFRLSGIVGDVISQKQEMFEKLIREKVQGITDAQIISLRQTIAGEVNKGKEAVINPAEIKEVIVVTE